MEKKQSVSAQKGDAKDKSMRKEPNPGSEKSGRKGDSQKDSKTKTAGHRQGGTNLSRKDEEDRKNNDNDEEETEE
jgi:hypothetical protein